MPTPTNLEILQGRPEITYPTQWEYRIITTDTQALQAYIQTLISKPYSLECKNTSKEGRFTSLHLKTIVENQEMRDTLYTKLTGLDCVKMVI
ncbi:hypothetical protein BKH46_09005 [Helicobacter sp. 12S02634-8]|uniref:HP0495 family protein n=1 Tax=Helicobacter sp. 12S02634-8 TaxID=1476199 RepID=UPI000BA4FC63|nr:DUF493 domain-containing protein [Helicobacter sp. 12S02634-8]PAF46115.1 hypothetical protein BKH46_09005 [Helicobacter sp. 12S02634-8]